MTPIKPKMVLNNSQVQPSIINARDFNPNAQAFTRILKKGMLIGFLSNLYDKDYTVTGKA